MSNDDEIIKASLVDPGAFAEIYDRHATRVYRYASRTCSREQAEDIMADTFLKAFEARERFDFKRSDARPWLLGIATNLLKKRARSEARFQVAAQRQRGRDEAAVDDDAVSRADASGVGGALREVLDRLNTRDRDCFLLYALGDLAYKEIAVALDIPVGTVRSRMNRVRKAFREQPDLQPTPFGQELCHE